MSDTTVKDRPMTARRRFKGMMMYGMVTALVVQK